MIFFSLLLTAAPALASLSESYCTPLRELHQRINFCYQNEGYPGPAKSCRDRYRSDVSAKEAEVKRLLGDLGKRASGPAQKVSFDTTNKSYMGTENELAGLIFLGKKAIQEMEEYAEDFVPPIPSHAPGYFKPNPKDAHDRARKASLRCYSKPMKELDGTLADMKKMVRELSETQFQVRSLLGISTDRDSNLLHIAEEGGQSLASAYKSSGEVGNGYRSTITGKIRGEEAIALGNLGVNNIEKGRGRVFFRRLSGHPASKGATEAAPTGSEAVFGSSAGEKSRHLARLPEPSPLADAAYEALQIASSLSSAGDKILEPQGVNRGLARIAQKSTAADSISSGVREFPVIEPDLAAAKSENFLNLFVRTHQAYERSQKLGKL